MSAAALPKLAVEAETPADKAKILNAIEQAARDPGAPFVQPILGAWKRLRDTNLAEYQRCRAAAKANGVPLSELERVLRDKAAATQAAPLVDPDPDPWPEAVDGATLLDEFANRLSGHVHMPEHAITVCATWALLTWLYDALDVLPLLVLRSPEKGCGKTTCLDVLARLVARPLSASGITAAALYRTIEAVAPTLLIDEADTFARDNDELRGVLNSGQTRTSSRVIRCVGEDFEPKAFSTWCPKVLAGIGRMPGTVEDRAFVVTLQRLAPGQKVARLRHRDRWPELRRQAARFAADHPTLPDPPPFEFLANRAADNWESLAAVAQATSGDWPARIEAAARHYADVAAADADGSTGVELLRDIRAIFEEESVSRLSSVDLVARLTADETSRWCEYAHGKPLTPRQLARQIEPFGITPKTIRMGDKTPKGYEREQFADAFARYLPTRGADSPATPPQGSNDTGSGRFAIRNTADDVADGKPEKCSNHEGCGGVADQTPPYEEKDDDVAVF